MKAFIYRADIYCEGCGNAIKRDLDTASLVTLEDSDHYPQGPYCNGGGEADCPQHCGACGVFLENPLTSDGVEYVREALTSDGDASILAEWRDFYSDELSNPH